MVNFEAVRARWMSSVDYSNAADHILASNCNKFSAGVFSQ